MRRLTIAAAAAASLLAAGITHAQGDAKHGQKLFEECHACHAVERGVNGVGPSLYGVFGRRAADPPIACRTRACPRRATAPT